MSCRSRSASRYARPSLFRLWAAAALAATVACSGNPEPRGAPSPSPASPSRAPTPSRSPTPPPSPTAPAEQSSPAAAARSSTSSSSPTHGRRGTTSIGELRRDIDTILADPALEHGYWGVVVKSLRTDETLYALNPRKLMMPASNMKIVTLAVAAERLGWDYTFETMLLARGTIGNGTLDGDLIVVGSGDPSFTTADGMADRVFGEWAARLKRSGIRTIIGQVIGDESAMDEQTLGFGWSWDDLPDDYAAGVAALQFNENMARVTIAPGPQTGDVAAVAMTPAGTGLTMVNSVVTSELGSAPAISMHRLPGSSRLELRGTIPLESQPVVVGVSVDSPALYFVTMFRAALIAHGIDVQGSQVAARLERPASKATAVATYRSPPLSTLALRLMKASQNQYAETLLRTIGGRGGAPTVRAGGTATEATMAEWGVAPDAVIQRDGSGLSRYDYVTPEALVTVLTHIDRVDKLRAPFETALPVAGRDGSLAERMKGTAAEGNARAKTGSMSNVRALSGYVTSADGERLVFSILANNFQMPAEPIVRATDAIVVRLAQFRR